MDTYCGADCSSCPYREGCKGCCPTCGSPFGGRCVAAEYIKRGGREAYQQFKEELTGEVNALLTARGLPPAAGLFELVGKYVNPAFLLPSGERVRFLEENNVYLGTQIEIAELGLCCGVVADTTFILICVYGLDGRDPELVLYQKR